MIVMEGNDGLPSHECLGGLCSHVIESRVEVGEFMYSVIIDRLQSFLIICCIVWLYIEWCYVICCLIVYVCGDFMCTHYSNRCLRNWL